MKLIRNRSLKAAVLAFTMAALPLAAFAQTRVSMPKNKYKVQDDIRLGNQASREVERRYPMLDDAAARDYVARLGEKLVSAIPAEFQQPAFDYQFDVVDSRELNAFALPGGPMFVNRGIIEAARNEGELAGVMAHEISHVALRHATAQQTKVSNPLNQTLGIGAILGGAVLGGEAGAQAGQIFAQGYFLRYNRDYETQADILGARIMAAAGYDPRDLANVFRTIEQQSGSRGAPEWLSSHPNPGNRYQKINQESSLLRVAANPIKMTPGFQRVQERLRGLPSGRSGQRTARTGGRRGGASRNPMPSGGYNGNVEMPSARTRVYQGGNGIEVTIPSNWRESESDTAVIFAPDGGAGNDGLTHGAMIGVTRTNLGDAYQATQSYVQSLMQSNNLRQQGGVTRSSVGGRSGYSAVLVGRSAITGQNEVVTIYTTELDNGDLFYAATVVPQAEAGSYTQAFRNLISSIRLND